MVWNKPFFSYYFSTQKALTSHHLPLVLSRLFEKKWGSFSTLWFSETVLPCVTRMKSSANQKLVQSISIKPTTPLHRGLQPFPTVPCVRFEPKAGSAASAQLTVIQPLEHIPRRGHPSPVAWMTPAVASGAAMPSAAHVVGGVAGALEDGRTQPGNRAGLTGNWRFLGIVFGLYIFCPRSCSMLCWIDCPALSSLSLGFLRGLSPPFILGFLFFFQFSTKLFLSCDNCHHISFSQCQCLASTVFLDEVVCLSVSHVCHYITLTFLCHPFKFVKFKWPLLFRWDWCLIC